MPRGLKTSSREHFRSYAEAALQYRVAGWRGVLPLPPGKKSPPPTGYTGDGRWPTTPELDEWARRRPDGNIALRLPKDVVGIDVDHYGTKRGGDTLAELETLCGALPPTWRSSARALPSGIRLFRVPEDVMLPSQAGKDIDIIQFGHRYLCVWPSVNPGTETQYQWYDPDGIACGPPKPQDLPNLPAKWCTHLESLAAGRRSFIAGSPASAVRGSMSPAVQKVLAETLLELPGGRHDAATRCTMRLEGLERSGHPGVTEARNALGEVFCQLVRDRASEDEARREYEDLIGSAAKKFSAEAWIWPTSEAPPVLTQAALPGLVGDVVATILPETEADAAALAADMLVSFGSAVGPGPHAFAGGREHPARLNMVLVGATSRGRKGTARAEIDRPFSLADPDWSTRCLAGLSTGEGLINNLHSEIQRCRSQEFVGESDDGVGAGWGHPEPDLRRLVVEPEFARVLGCFHREHNTLSAVLRDIYDSGSVAVLTRGNPLRVDGAHVSIIGHITQEELRRKLSSTEMANGFANRFLYVVTTRSKLLPSGGNLPDQEIARLGDEIRRHLDKARSVGRIVRTPEAEERWHDLYAIMADADIGGLVGAVTARAEAQVLRLSLTYALMSDEPARIDLEDLEAAWAMWQYCERSAAAIWGRADGDRDSERLSQALKEAGENGLSMTEVSALFGRNRTSTHIERMLEKLEQDDKISRRQVPTGGRPKDVVVIREPC